MEAAKEKISNIYASAKAGMDKTKATAEDKVEKVKTKDPLQKNMAEERKEEKIRQAELEKQQVIRRMLKGEAHHTGVEHQTGGHHTSEGHQTSLGDSTDGVTGQQRTDAQTVRTKRNLIGH